VHAAAGFVRTYAISMDATPLLTARHYISICPRIKNSFVLLHVLQALCARMSSQWTLLSISWTSTLQHLVMRLMCTQR
jgi:hypothetical protein